MNDRSCDDFYNSQTLIEAEGVMLVVKLRTLIMKQIRLLREDRRNTKEPEQQQVMSCKKPAGNGRKRPRARWLIGNRVQL